MRIWTAEDRDVPDLQPARRRPPVGQHPGLSARQSHHGQWRLVGDAQRPGRVHARAQHEIINPWFVATAFVGALIFTAAAVLTSLGRAGLPWVAAALRRYLIAFVVTVAVNVPLNDTIKAAGNPDHIRDLASVRGRFHETRWAAWNLVRAASSAGAFACLA
jgi:hypothetical protein